MTINLTNRHLLWIGNGSKNDRLQTVTTVDATNKEFLKVLFDSFSACEWYGLVCRCFGPHYAEFPMLVAQDDYIKSTAQWAYDQPVNRFFFTELLRLRPQHRDCIYQRMEELKLTIRRKNIEQKQSLSLWADSRRFSKDLDNGLVTDSMTGVSHSHFTKDVSSMELVVLQQIYEDILLLSQLPIHSFQKVTDIHFKDGVMDIYSTAVGEAVSLSGLNRDDHTSVILIAEALDAAHQRDVFHGPIHPEHIRQTENGEIILGGFGEAALSGSFPSMLDDHKAMAALLELCFPNSMSLTAFCTQLREDRWNRSMSELVHEVIESFVESDVIPLEQRPAKLELVSSERISVQLGFQNSTHQIRLRKKGDAPLVLESSPLPPWLGLVPSKIDPSIQEQELTLTIYTKALKEGLNRFAWTVKDQNGAEIAVQIEAKRSPWLMPTLVLFVCLAIAGLLVLSRLAS